MSLKKSNVFFILTSLLLPLVSSPSFSKEVYNCYAVGAAVTKYVAARTTPPYESHSRKVFYTDIVSFKHNQPDCMESYEDYVDQKWRDFFASKIKNPTDYMIMNTVKCQCKNEKTDDSQLKEKAHEWAHKYKAHYCKGGYDIIRLEHFTIPDDIK